MASTIKVPKLEGVAPEILKYIDELKGSIITDQDLEKRFADRLKDETPKIIEAAVKSGDLVKKADVKGGITKEAHDEAIAAKDKQIAQQTKLIEMLENQEPQLPAGALAIDLASLATVTDDLCKLETFTPDQWLHVETINFRNDSGYSLNMFDRAKAAIDRAFKLSKTGETILIRPQFGTLDAGGQQTYDRLPPFTPGNRLVVIVGVIKGD